MKNKFLTPALCRSLCNVLIEPHFVYVSSAWYPNLTQKMKNKIQITQKNCIWYCLELDKMTHILKNECETDLINFCSQLFSNILLNNVPVI